MVFCPGALQSVARKLVKSYEQKTGNTVKFEFGTAGAIAKRVAEGAQGDVVLATNTGLANLAKEGKVDGASIRDLGSVDVGVAVKAGAPKPDIHDLEWFKKSMLTAKSIMYANPAKGRAERHSHRQGDLRRSASTSRSNRNCSCAIADRTA